MLNSMIEDKIKVDRKTHNAWQLAMLKKGYKGLAADLEGKVKKVPSRTTLSFIIRYGVTTPEMAKCISEVLLN